MAIGRELDWGDIIEEESAGYALIDEGDYPFRVEKFERGRHGGSEKLPACNKAILTIGIYDENGGRLTEITHNLFLHSSVEGILSAFFLSIGQKRHGEKLSMNWQAVPGSTGICHVIVDKWTGKDGAEKQSNKIKYFCDPAKQTAQPTQTAASQPQQMSMNVPTNTGWGRR